MGAAATKNELAGPASQRVRVRRGPQRAAYDRATIDAILDAGAIAHIAFNHQGSVVVVPTFYWRSEDSVYWHGSHAGRMAKAKSFECCFAVTHFDGLVLARSAFHHSANYRSVVIHGVARAVEDAAARDRLLREMFEIYYPGRWELLRPATEAEMKATDVFSLPIAECSAKVREGGASEPLSDAEWPVWAGTIPIDRAMSAPLPDARTFEEKFPVPSYRRVG